MSSLNPIKGFFRKSNYWHVYFRYTPSPTRPHFPLPLHASSSPLDVLFLRGQSKRRKISHPGLRACYFHLSDLDHWFSSNGSRSNRNYPAEGVSLERIRHQLHMRSSSNTPPRKLLSLHSSPILSSSPSQVNLLISSSHLCCSSFSLSISLKCQTGEVAKGSPFVNQR